MPSIAKLVGVFLLVLSLPAAEETPPITSTRTVQQVMEAARDSVVVIKQSARGGIREAVGTGFVISKDGLIATSLHVIGEARPITITFADGKSSAVTEIHAWDRKLDLAIVRVANSDLKPLRLGDSDNLKQGASVIAVGNPQGLTHSVVQGVISAFREFEFGKMIQLAIPIEPGNSGGPLLDLKGRVQGILEMKSAVTDNLGFAIPINALKPLLEHPNSVPFEKWLALGALNESLWKPLMGANWRRKAGMITVEGAGAGFGGRSLCISAKEPPSAPYELAVSVRLEDESGAAGLAFGWDGADRHYGFYPSAGQLRLTRFDGPTVFTWNILRQIETPYYNPGEWNQLKVRVEPDKISCYVNGHLITEVDGEVVAGPAGLAKFRNTSAQFKNFVLAKRIETEAAPSDDLVRKMEIALHEQKLSEEMLKEPANSRAMLLTLARNLDHKAESARKLARELHQKNLERELASLFLLPEGEIDLFAAAFVIARVEAPDVELSLYREELDHLAAEVRKRFTEGSTAREKLDHLRKALFEENGFHGSRSDYYNRANSFLNRVMEDREGIPITLSVLFLELGRQLGIENLDGMPFPGHFMIRFTLAEQEPVYIDVYDGGKLYQKNDLFFVIANHSEVPLLDEHFRPASKKEIIVRMLRNLIGFPSESAARILPYVDLLLAISPDDAQERLRRASLRLQTGERALAREDLEWVLKHKPRGVDLERVEDLYRTLK